MIKNLINADDEATANGTVETERTNALVSLFDLSPATTEQASELKAAAESSGIDDSGNVEPKQAEPAIVIEPFVPPSKVETIRRSGLAWSAGVVFFGSVGFMMILGWFADLLLDSAPYGLVVGIVLGSIIGFVNFFRITSQIFKNN